MFLDDNVLLFDHLCEPPQPLINIFCRQQGEGRPYKRGFLSIGIKCSSGQRQHAAFYRLAPHQLF